MPDEADAVTRVPADPLRRWTTTVFVRLGLPDDDAALVAETLVWASLRGVDSHGVMRVPIYAARLRQGGINSRPRIRVARETAATALIDGDNGMGQVVSRFAMDLALRKAREAGTSYVLARDSNHFGAAGYWSELALNHDMIGWATTNTAPIVAPWGSKQARIGNNPLAIAAPAGEEAPLLLDMALSMVAGGKLRYAARKGSAIPDDWALDPEGHPTTDPNAGLAGVLLPTGKHKGSGLAILIETLTGLLAGAAWGDSVQYIWQEPEKRGNVTSAFGAFDIAAFGDPGTFKRQVDQLARHIATSEPAPGFDRVQLPGGPELATRAERLRAGIPLPGGVLAELRQLGRELDLSFEAVTADERD